MFATKQSQAYLIISLYDFEVYTNKEFAVETNNQTVREYRQFMFLQWIKHRHCIVRPIVPSIRAEQVWKTHLSDRSKYTFFCKELVGTVIMFNSEYESSNSVEYTAGLINAADIQRKFGNTDNFSDFYCNIK